MDTTTLGTTEVQAVVNYLQTKPYQEVADLLSSLVGSVVKPEDISEAPKTDTFNEGYAAGYKVGYANKTGTVPVKSAECETPPNNNKSKPQTKSARNT